MRTEDDAGCIDKKKALPLKIIPIISILKTSMIGVCLPLVTRSIPALDQERSLFVIVNFASGIILATGFIHVLPDSFDMLSSSCLKENPWHKFPFTGFVAMLSTIFTLVIDSVYILRRINLEWCCRSQEIRTEPGGHHHGGKLNVEGSQLLRTTIYSDCNGY